METLTKEIDISYVKNLLKDRLKKPRKRLRALVMVLGDIGHSPRMQYHVSSLAKEQFDVDFLGFKQSEPRSEILHNSAIDLHIISDVPTIFRSRFPRLLYLPIKVFWLMISIFYQMINLQKPDIILIQNPPTFPIVFCAFMYNYFWQAAVILDWHNYSYSIMGINWKRPGLLRTLFLKLMEFIERISSQLSDANICVSDAMGKDMLKRWNSRATTLYDRAPSDFGPNANLEARHYLFMKLGVHSSAFRTDKLTCSGTETIFTRKDCGEPASLKEDRPALLVSSTSWTEDEDFGLLFDALKLYDSSAQTNSERYPKIVTVVTGKGPLKDFYMEKIRKENLSMVSVTSCWLETADYPKLLGAADLGVCLHYSSSGLDLPMKVVDMFGCGIPVCAVKYNCIEELIKPNQNGLLFESASELHRQLCDLMAGFPNSTSDKMCRLKKGSQSFRESTWHENWKSVLLPLITETVEIRTKTQVNPKHRLLFVCGFIAIFAIASVWLLKIFGFDSFGISKI